MKKMLTKLPIRLVSISVAVTAVVSILIATTIALVSPEPAYADHNSMYAVCPDPILEGNTGQIGIRRPGHRIVKATFFTQHEYYTADPSDFEEYQGFTVEVKGGRKTLYAPIVTKEDSLPEHD